ncbi:hypothetical protein WH47_00908 [Habropoda laboriosa]|uniref:Mos1 transposase HTH domain-containing protein n=1 Tax=Habropoda laboriosa TaxID=597456 RepID=A0A0L7RK87_9HYME|nr:hypothetical protein WH47_00908 [Habropoda laboriosa]
MSEDQADFRHILLFYFKKGRNAAQATNKICRVCGENAVFFSSILIFIANNYYYY